MDLQPAAQRRLRQRQQARRAILDATQALLVEGGFERFSMRRLADRCGYTPPTVYYYFGDKQGLIDALLEERFSLLLSRLRRVLQSPVPRTRLPRPRRPTSAWPSSPSPWARCTPRDGSTSKISRPPGRFCG